MCGDDDGPGYGYGYGYGYGCGCGYGSGEGDDGDGAGYTAAVIGYGGRGRRTSRPTSTSRTPARSPARLRRRRDATPRGALADAFGLEAYDAAAAGMLAADVVHVATPPAVRVSVVEAVADAGVARLRRREADRPRRRGLAGDPGARRRERHGVRRPSSSDGTPAFGGVARRSRQATSGRRPLSSVPRGWCSPIKEPTVSTTRTRRTVTPGSGRCSGPRAVPTAGGHIPARTRLGRY